MSRDLFGEVRSVLQNPPSQATFYALCQLFEDGTCPDAILPYIESHIDRWPDDVMRWVPYHWFHLKGGEFPKLVSLCNALALPDPSTPFYEFVSFLDSEHLPRLTTLDLARFHPEPSQWEQLGEYEASSEITSLNITGCRLDDEALDAVCDLPFFPGLRSLDAGYNNLGRGGLQRLASVPWSGLESLQLRANKLDADACAVFSQFGEGARLKELDVSWNPIGPQGVAAMASAVCLQGVTSLRLDYCDLTSHGLAHLVTAHGFQELESLSLQSNAIESLSHTTHHRFARFSRLRALSLAANQLRAENVRYLLEDDIIPQLTSLDLSYTELQNAGAELVAACERFDSLRHLDLGMNRLGHSGIRALANAPWIARLDTLMLGGNDLRLDAIVELCESPYLPPKLKEAWRSQQRQLDGA